MEAIEKVKNIEDELDCKIKKIYPKFVKTRTKARVWRVVVISLGVATTIVLGVEDLSWGKKAGFIFSALLTGVSTIETLFNYASKSIQEHDYYVKLTNLKNDIEYYKTGKVPEEYEVSDIDNFHEEYKKIRTEFHSSRINAVESSYENSKDKSK